MDYVIIDDYEENRNVTINEKLPFNNKALKIVGKNSVKISFKKYGDYSASVTLYNYNSSVQHDESMRDIYCEKQDDQKLKITIWGAEKREYSSFQSNRNKADVIDNGWNSIPLFWIDDI
jgi:hypothetical protein